MGMNKIAKDKLKGWFREKLLAGAFPEVEYKENGNGMRGYNLIEYSTKWARVSKVFDDRMKIINPKFSLFASRLRSGIYLMAIDTVLSEMTVEEVDAGGERFRTAWD